MRLYSLILKCSHWSLTWTLVLCEEHLKLSFKQRCGTWGILSILNVWVYVWMFACVRESVFWQFLSTLFLPLCLWDWDRAEGGVGGRSTPCSGCKATSGECGGGKVGLHCELFFYLSSISLIDSPLSPLFALLPLWQIYNCLYNPFFFFPQVSLPVSSKSLFIFYRVSFYVVPMGLWPFFCCLIGGILKLDTH